jgi:hypothetical protein
VLPTIYVRYNIDNHSKGSSVTLHWDVVKLLAFSFMVMKRYCAYGMSA